MKRVVQGILVVLLGLFGLITLILLALPLIYDTEDLKLAAASAVKERTGRDLTVNGDLSLSVFPWLALEANDVALGHNPASTLASGTTGSFAELDQARLGVALMPLLRGEVVIDTVQLDGLALDLQIDASGLSNWQDLSEFAEPAEETSSTSGSEPSSSLEVLEIGGLDLRNARIAFVDASADLSYDVSGLTLTTGNLGDLINGGAVAINGSARVQDRGGDLLVNTQLEASLTANSAFTRLRFDDVKSSIAVEGSPEVRLFTDSMVVDIESQTLDVPAFVVDLQDVSLTGGLTATQIIDNPAFAGELEIAETSPRELMQTLAITPPQTTDPDALTRFSGSFNYVGDLNALTLEPLNLQLDDSTLTGTATMTQDGRLSFDLAIDQLNADRYLPPEETSSTPSPGNTDDAETVIPVEALRGLNIAGRLQIEQLTIMNITLENSNVTINGENGLIRLKPVSAGVMGGQYEGDISIDVRDTEPLVRFNEKLVAVPFQALAGDLFNAESLSGLAKGQFQGTMRGNTVEALIGSLDGNLGMDLDEGALEGIDLWYEIRSTLAAFQGAEPPTDDAGRTPFSVLNLAADIDNGVLHTRTLQGVLPFLMLDGDGTINLNAMTVELTMNATIRDVPDVNQDPLTADLSGRKVPLEIRGSLDSPGVSVDIEELIKSEAAQKILDRFGVDSEINEADSVEGAARSLLKGFFGSQGSDEKEPEEDDDGPDKP